MFLDRHISESVGPSDTVNHGVLESLELFGAAGGDSPGYQGVATGGAAAALTNVANNSMQLSTNEIRIQEEEYPLRLDDGFFTPDNSGRDADDVFGPSDNVNYGVLESLKLFGAAGGDSAGYQGAATGAAESTNVAINSLHLSTNESPGNFNADYNHAQLPSSVLTNVANSSMQQSMNVVLPTTTCNDHLPDLAL